MGPRNMSKRLVIAVFSCHFRKGVVCKLNFGTRSCLTNHLARYPWRVHTSIEWLILVRYLKEGVNPRTP